MSRSAALAVALALSACGAGPSEGDASAALEGDASGDCTDGVDNDADGLLDCAEPGCAGGAACAGEGPAERLHLCGRFDRSDPESLAFEWPGSAIGARFSGTGVSVTLESEGRNFFEVRVDGVSAAPIETSWGEETFELAYGLAPGEHDVLVVRRTEAFMGRVAFRRFLIPDGKVLRSPSPWAHRLEFIGDSVTAGYGALGAGPECGFSPATESAWASFASVAARSLGACAHLLAWSGKGVYQNWGGDAVEPMPALYPRTLPTDPDSLWDFSFAAEAVVIRLGGNDLSSPADRERFEAAFADLLRAVRGRHPDATIYCVGGGFQDATAVAWAQGAIAAVGDPKVRLLALPGLEPGEGWGCDYHPSAAAHARIGGVLAGLLRADLGW